ncbi:MAG: carbohydrate ABC transporter permease [Christensenellales bacterium]|jgi:putative aldouronate transport system permease protein
MTNSAGRKMFIGANAAFIAIICLATIIPFWMVIITSLSSNEVAAKEGFVFIPKGLELTSYVNVFSSGGYFRAFIRSLWVTVVATALSMLLSTTMAYALAQKELIWRNGFMNLVLITMVIDGGIIPFYMVVRQLGMINSYFSLIIPMAISTYNLILMRNFFRSIPSSLIESARLDGSNEAGILVKIVLPVSVPILAAIMLFYAVGHWNRYFEVVMFINSSNKYTLQVLLRQLIFHSEGDGTYSVMVNNFKMAVMVIAMLPILLLYPFIQKYFISGLMLGSIKG